MLLMAKSPKFSILLLFAAGTFLTGMAWLMRSFPLFAFFGLAPFIAIVYGQKNEESIWNSLELILLGLGLSYFCALFFAFDHLLDAIFLAMVFTLPFLGVSFRRSLGQGAGLLALAFFWLTAEYIGLKIAFGRTVFLADMVALKPQWVRWNVSTGYLGGSAWILLSNILLFKACLEQGKFNWFFLFLFLAFVAAPMAYSYTLSTSALDKAQMLRLYANDTQGLSPTYVIHGEWIPRTATWVSVLMVLYSFVRKRITKK